MMLDDTTPIKQRIERAMVELVDLNNQGVHLLGEGRLDLARTAIYHATDRIQQVREAQAQLEEHMAQYHPPAPQNLVLGVPGRCFVTPLEPGDDEVVTMVVDPMASYTFRPEPHPIQSPTTTSLAATATNDNTSHEGRNGVSSNEAGVLNQATTPVPLLPVEVLLVGPPSPSSPKTSSSPIPGNLLLEQEQQEHQQQSANPSIPSRPRPMMLYSFLRPIFFSAQDFLHVVNPPLTHLSVCLLFNLAVVNHKMAMRIQASSTSPTPSPPSSLHGAAVMNDEDDHRRRMLVPLQEAIYLYKLAYRIQVEDRLVEVSRLHTLGILNNLGQLYYHAEMYTISKDCFVTLLEMIMIHRVRDQGSLFLWNAALFWELNSHHGETFLHQQILYIQEQVQLIQQDAPYMELFLDNIFDVLADPQISLHAPAA